MTKFELSEQHKSDRAQAAKELLQWPEDKRHSLVFVDAASMTVCCEQRSKVWVNLLREKEREHIVFHPAFHEPHPLHLVWYVALHPHSNTRLLWLATGTSGIQGSWHKVSLPGFPLPAAHLKAYHPAVPSRSRAGCLPTEWEDAMTGLLAKSRSCTAAAMMLSNFVASARCSLSIVTAAPWLH